MVRATTYRQPRFAFAILVLLFIAALFFHTPTTTSLRNLARSPAPVHLVHEHIRTSELIYQDFLVDRQDLINKVGPTKEQVQSFPLQPPNMHTLWDFFVPAFQCPWRVRRMGILGDGGKFVCGVERIARQKNCVIYSFGINGESSFEAQMLEVAPGCEVWGYDFSVKSFGPEIMAVPELANRSHFFAYALGAHDAHAPYDRPKTYTLESLMAKNGHTFVDVLKIDIEGNEFSVLESIVRAFPKGLPFGQLQLEIHAWGPEGKFDRFLRWWEMLEGAGLRPFWLEPNMVYMNIITGAKPHLVEYAFLNIGEQHYLLSDDYGN